MDDIIRMYRGEKFSFLVAAGHIDDGQHVFENFPPAGEFVVRQKKKVRLVDRVGSGHVELRPRDAPWGWQINLPKRLFLQPIKGNVFRNLCCCSQFFDGYRLPPITLWAVVKF